MKKMILLIFLSYQLFSTTLNIAVSANVSYAIDQLRSEFNKMYPDVKVRFIVGGSGKLMAQIKHGAPYGIFMSANMIYPDALYKNKLALLKPKIYAFGALAYFSIKAYNFKNDIKYLENENIKRIAIANPKTAPYGKASIQAIKKLGLYKKLKSKFVYAESIAQTVMYATTACDFGIVALSSLYSPKMKQYKKGINWFEVDKTLYTTIKQGIVLLNNSKEYKAFYYFILSDKAKSIFKKYGYTFL